MTLPYLKEKSIDSEIGKIFYYVDNAFKDMPTIVFLHGLSANHTTWLPEIDMLHKNQYNSLAVDLRGHGLSDKTKKRFLYKIPVFTNDLKQIIEAEQLKKVFIVGYSFGGSIAIDYTIKYQDNVLGLILISANHVNPLEYRKIKFLTFPLYGFLNLLALLLIWQKGGRYYYHYGQSKNYWHSVWIGLNTMPLSINFWILSNILRLNFKYIISDIKVPTLIIRAKNDLFLLEAEVKSMVEKIDKARVIISNHNSHFLASRNKGEIQKNILDFIKNYS
jgi:pimeloyl-ACP methyl ester carboxylesterase